MRTPEQKTPEGQSRIAQKFEEVADAHGHGQHGAAQPLQQPRLARAALRARLGRYGKGQLQQPPQTGRQIVLHFHLLRAGQTHKAHKKDQQAAVPLAQVVGRQQQTPAAAVGGTQGIPRFRGPGLGDIPGAAHAHATFRPVPAQAYLRTGIHLYSIAAARYARKSRERSPLKKVKRKAADSAARPEHIGKTRFSAKRQAV